MAIVQTTLNVIKSLIDELNSQKPEAKERNILALGYPDILASREYIETMFGKNVAKAVQAHPDSDSIIRWHNAQNATNFVPEAKQLFNLLGFNLEVVDIVKARGDEIIADLNEPVQPDLHERYDMIVDTGTIEHCFNIAQAMKNLAQMTSKGGYIFQSNPLSWFNHGFYNINPTFYYDFYQENGFDIIWFEGLVNGIDDPKLVELPPYERFCHVPEDMTNIVVSQRKSIVDINWPVQTKYKKNSLLKG